MCLSIITGHQECCDELCNVACSVVKFSYNEVIQVKSFKEKVTIDTFSRKFALHSALVGSACNVLISFL